MSESSKIIASLKYSISQMDEYIPRAKSTIAAMKTQNDALAISIWEGRIEIQRHCATNTPCTNITHVSDVLSLSPSKVAKISPFAIFPNESGVCVFCTECGRS